MNDGDDVNIKTGMTPDSVEEIDFAIVRRGYESDAVKQRLRDAAAEIRRLHGVISDLSRRVEQFESTPVEQLESRRVAEALGDEAARLLQAARDAAQERVERADAESEEIVGRARAAASAIVEEGRDEGREIVTEARRVRERMLADLARRQHTHRVEVEQLTTIRDRLLDSLSRCRRGLIEWVEELTQVGPQAVAAAERAGLRIAAGPEPTIRQIEAEIEASGLAAAVAVESDAAEPPPLRDDRDDQQALDGALRPESAEARHPGASTVIDEDAVGDDEDIRLSEAEEALVVLDDSVSLSDASAESSPLVSVAGASGDIGLYDVEAEPDVQAEVETATRSRSEAHAEPDAQAEVETGSRSESDVVLEPIPAELSAPPSVVETSDAQAIFARLRAVEVPDPHPGERADAVESASQPGLTDSTDASAADPDSGSDDEEADSEPPTSPDATAPEEAADPVPEAPPGRPDDLVQSASSAAVGAIAQGLKRLIVEEQGELLDAIRREGADAVEAMLDADAHAYARCVRGPLQDFASDVDISIDDIDLGAAGAAAVKTLVTPLRSQLKDLLDEADDPAELSSAVRAVYRESRTNGSHAAARAAFSAGWS